MANDINMWNDIEELEKDGKSELAEELMSCFCTKYNEEDDKLAEQLKNEFIEKHGYWGNYY